MARWMVRTGMLLAAGYALITLLRGRPAPAFAERTTTEPVPWPEIPADPSPTGHFAPVATP